MFLNNAKCNIFECGNCGTQLFEIDKVYRVKPKDNIYPVLDSDGNDMGIEEISISDPLTFRVTGFPIDKPGFITVFNLMTNKEHLYYMARTERLEVLKIN